MWGGGGGIDSGRILPSDGIHKKRVYKNVLFTKHSSADSFSPSFCRTWQKYDIFGGVDSRQCLNLCEVGDGDESVALPVEHSEDLPDLLLNVPVVDLPVELEIWRPFFLLSFSNRKKITVL